MRSSPHHITAPPDPPPAEPAGTEAAAAPEWAALRRARQEGPLLSLAAAEDGVFRLYLPLARALAADFVGGAAAAPVEVEWAAELALAKAVLGWPGDDGRGFQAYARATIIDRLRRQAPSPGHQRATAAARWTSTMLPTGGVQMGR